jgi:large subunit ribosomal protein L10
MNKEEKAREIDSLKEVFRDTPPVFVLGYRGLTVNQVAALRKRVRAASSRYKVVKNRLALRAVRETSLGALAAHFEGPTAIAYTARDPSTLAKVLDEFTREHQGLSLKAGLVDGRLMDVQAIKTLASLPSREALVGRLLAVLNGPMVRLVTVLKGPARSLVRAMDEIAKKKETTGRSGPATGAVEGPGAVPEG